MKRLLRRGAPADAHGFRRLRQDPPVPAGCRRLPRALSGRRRGWSSLRRCPTLASCRRPVATVLGARGRAGQADYDDARRASQGQAAPAAARQLRAPARCAARGWPSRSLRQCPQRDDPREQPGGARHRRRADLPRAVAVAARSEGDAYAGVDRAHSRRCSCSSIAALLARCRTFGSRENAAALAVHLSSAGRDSAGHRTGGGTGALALRRGDQSAGWIIASAS